MIFQENAPRMSRLDKQRNDFVKVGLATASLKPACNSDHYTDDLIAAFNHHVDKDGGKLIPCFTPFLDDEYYFFKCDDSVKLIKVRGARDDSLYIISRPLQRFVVVK